MVVEKPLAARELGRVFRAPLARRRVAALRSLSFEIEAGQVLGLLGPNGSGKTTAMRCCLGLLRPSRGQARLFGLPPGRAIRPGMVGYAPERFEPSPGRSGRETLLLLGALAGLRGAGLAARCDRLLLDLDLVDAAARRVGSYSKGMLRRLALAQAFLAEPRLLVLDEPFDGLDPLGVLAVRDEIARRAAAGAAVLVSSHALADLEAVSTHLLVMAAGASLDQGPKDEVLAQRDRVRLELEGLSAAGLAAVRAAVAESGGRVVQEEPARESLEEFFRRRVEPPTAAGGAPRGRAEGEG